MIRPETKMIVGLGNPGDKYADTRHNIGFKLIDSLSGWLKTGSGADIAALGSLTEVKKKKFGARFGEGRFLDKKLILLKPQCFMNCSGQVVATAMGFYRLELSNLLVMSDDMALEPGRIRVRTKGSAGGHNGLADIIEKLGTDKFARLRIGIGQNGGKLAEDYVLDRPLETERALLDRAIDRARQAVLCWINDGIEAAMNKFNETVNLSD